MTTMTSRFSSAAAHASSCPARKAPKPNRSFRAERSSTRRQYKRSRPLRARAGRSFTPVAPALRYGQARGQPLRARDHLLGPAARRRQEAHLLPGLRVVHDDPQPADALVAVLVEVRPGDLEPLPGGREPGRIELAGHGARPAPVEGGLGLSLAHVGAL